MRRHCIARHHAVITQSMAFTYGGLDADLRLHTGRHQGAYTELLQSLVQIGARETTIVVFDNDGLAGRWFDAKPLRAPTARRTTHFGDAPLSQFALHACRDVLRRVVGAN